MRGTTSNGIFLSTPSARRATRRALTGSVASAISIHALREEGDQEPVSAEQDVQFLSTPSARRATHSPQCGSGCKRYFYPRPPRGGRPSPLAPRSTLTRFLSTPSARRATSPSLFPILTAKHFYPRPPRGGRPVPIALLKLLDTISIHALREEGDLLHGVHLLCGVYFYPRPPRGGRLINGFQMAQVQLFLSTPSARRATVIDGNNAVSYEISIHALREEGDLPLELALTLICDFYPRPPRGGRPAQRGKSSDWRLFLSTPSARRATSRRSPGRLRTTISIHALREEGDHDLPRYLPAVPISIHALREEGDCSGSCIS